MNRHPILILEGADAAGKTTLAKAICEEYGAKYIHATVTDNAFEHHFDVLRQTIVSRSYNPVVVDRHWISEQIYGPIMRDGPQYKKAAKLFDLMWQTLEADYILCVPTDLEEQYRRWQRDKSAGKDEYPDEARIKQIIAAYADLRHGNVGHPGDLYIDELIRFGDFTIRSDVFVYDMDEHLGDAALKKYVKGLVL